MTLVANARGKDEMRIANDYTYRQLFHIVGVILKDRLFVVSSVLGAFGAGKPKGPAKGTTSSRKKGRLPDWYRPLNPRIRNRRVVDLDGPISELAALAGGFGAKGRVR